MPATEKRAKSPVHPLFDRHPKYQWTGKLPDLFKRLMKDAPKPETKGFAWRVLRGGALVGIRIHPEYLRPELKIARQEPADTPEKQAKFNTEVGIFLNHFKVHAVDGSEPAETDGSDWLILPNEPEDEGKAVARFLQLRKGETEPGKALCHPCREAGVAKTVIWFPGGGVMQRCTPHAFQAGKEWTMEVLARLEGPQEPEVQVIDLMKALTDSLKGKG